MLLPFTETNIATTLSFKIALAIFFVHVLVVGFKFLSIYAITSSSVIALLRKGLLEVLL